MRAGAVGLRPTMTPRSGGILQPVILQSLSPSFPPRGAVRPGRGTDRAGLFHHRDSSIVLPPQEEQKASAHVGSRGAFT